MNCRWHFWLAGGHLTVLAAALGNWMVYYESAVPGPTCQVARVPVVLHDVPLTSKRMIGLSVRHPADTEYCLILAAGFEAGDDKRQRPDIREGERRDTGP